MPQRTTRRRIATINYQENQLVREQLPISGKIRRLRLELRGTLNVTDDTAAYAIARNPGTLIPHLAVILDREITLKQGRWNDFYDRSYMHWKLGTNVPDTNAVNATEISSFIPISFVMPLAVKPVDTVLDMDAHQRLDLEIQWLDREAVVAGGTAAWTVEPTIDVIAEISRFDPPPNGFFIENAIQTAALGLDAVTDDPIELVTGPRKNYHHLLLVAEDDVANTCWTLEDAISQIVLQQQGAGELSYPFGIMSGIETQEDFDALYRTVDGIQTGLYPIHFCNFDGRKTFFLETAGLDDLRLLVNYDFTTDGRIRVLQGTYEPFLI